MMKLPPLNNSLVITASLAKINKRCIPRVKFSPKLGGGPSFALPLPPPRGLGRGLHPLHPFSTSPLANKHDDIPAKGSINMNENPSNTDTARVSPNNTSALTESEYHKLADDFLDLLTDAFEDIGDTFSIDGYDAMLSAGVLTLRLGDSGTFVINKQPPNMQIWLSSPVSGPRRYDYRDGAWVDKTHKSLVMLMEEELSVILDQPISLS